MKEVDFIISGFARDAHSDSSFIVDFSKAKLLDRDGSTCDAYECIIQRRRVFVKRLKPEFRDNPLYRDAFDKEYDLGVSLSHPSLPRYVGYGSDYLVMDFIEGDTLAELIKRGDNRLKERGFVKKYLVELIDVVEYLHNRNIVHCDIKADNIIISPYNDRPVSLIDLDKAYTAWLRHTPGDPAKYDCLECDDGVIDFRGLGRIAEQLGRKDIASACRKKDVTAAAIRNSLTRHTPGSLFRKWWLMPAGLLLAGIIAFLVIKQNSQPSEQSPPLQPQSEDSIAQAPVNELPAIDIGTKDQPNDSPSPNPVVNTPKAPAEENETAKAAPKNNMQEVDAIVNQYYGPLYSQHKYLRSLAANPKVSAEELLQAIRRYGNAQNKAQGSIFKAIMNVYGLSDPFESVKIACENKEWGRFMSEDAEINKLYSREIKKREEADSLKR